MFSTWTVLDFVATFFWLVCVVAGMAIPLLKFPGSTFFQRLLLTSEFAAIGWMLLHGRTHLGGPGSW